VDPAVDLATIVANEDTIALDRFDQMQQEGAMEAN
jgi:hypothetical protein